MHTCNSVLLCNSHLRTVIYNNATHITPLCKENCTSQYADVLLKFVVSLLSRKHGM